MTYIFDFARETARLRSDYPDVARNVVFLDLSSPDAVQKLIEWNTLNGGPVQAQLMTDAKFREMFVHRAMGGPGFYKSFSGEGGLIAMDASKPIASGLKDKNKSLFQILAHEFGHALFPSSKNKNLSECLADAFSLLYGARHRVLDARDAENLSQMRAAQGLIDGLTSHITTRALDSIAKAICKGAGLTPVHVIDLARAHAEKGAFSAAQLSGLKAVFDRFSEKNRDALATHRAGAKKRALLSDAALANPALRDGLKGYFSDSSRCLGVAGRLLKSLPFTQSAAHAALCAKTAKYLGNRP